VVDDPRRLVLADLVARIVSGLAGSARAYETASGRSDGPLRQALEELGRAKHAQAADLTPLARTLGVSPTPPPSATPVEALPGWGVVLGEAFQAERTLEKLGRELAGLTPDPSVRALALRLAAGAGRDGGYVRKLYLRYS
jgi:hypothetical protein